MRMRSVLIILLSSCFICSQISCRGDKKGNEAADKRGSTLDELTSGLKQKALIDGVVNNMLSEYRKTASSKLP